jgi:hypothetical protein
MTADTFIHRYILDERSYVAGNTRAIASNRALKLVRVARLGTGLVG